MIEQRPEGLIVWRGDVADRSPVLFCCEHSGNRLPAPIVASADDRVLLASHWGYDIGVRELVDQLVGRLRSASVHADFSRLLCDTNRPWSSPQCIRRRAEGRPVSFNSAIDDSALAWRRRHLYDAYHDAVDALLAARLELDRRVWLLSVHSFTPVLGAEQRTMEVGVLHDARHRDAAVRLARALAASGYRTALNQPYSGFDGLIHSVQRHGLHNNVPYLELELRQDLIAEPTAARTHADRLAQVLERFSPRG